MFRWDPQDYAVSSAAQSDWARELIDRLELAGNERILDVGCGDGRNTAELSLLVPRGTVVGIDSSADMIAHARSAHDRERYPNLDFVDMDACTIRFDEPFDLVFSNAALHWVEDHRAFLRGAASVLKSGGRLIVSCGGHGNAEDVFKAVRAEIRTQQWKSFFRNLKKPYFFHRPEDYQRWLPAAGFQPGMIRLAEKLTRLRDVAAFAAWIRTTWLPYTHRVPEVQRDQFISDVADRYLEHQPADSGGAVTVRMVRLELDAVRK